MTVGRVSGRERRGLALVAVFSLLASLTIVFSPPALGNGNSPSAECGSTDPAWNGDFWKVQNDGGAPGTVETNVAGAIDMDADGSWINNESPVFRVVMNVGIGVGDGLVLSGIWGTGDGGTVDLTLLGLGHVTFCFTDAFAESTTTTTSSTTTTSAGATTTTSAGATTTTTASPSTTTTSDASTPTAGESTTAESDETNSEPSDATATSTANLPEGSDSGQTNDASQGDEPVEETEESTTADNDLSPETNRDTTAAAGLSGPGEPPAPGQESSDAAPFVFRNPHQWALADLAIIGALVAAVVALLNRKRLRRLVGDLGERWR